MVKRTKRAAQVTVTYKLNINLRDGTLAFNNSCFIIQPVINAEGNSLHKFNDTPYERTLPDSLYKEVFEFLDKYCKNKGK